MKLYTKRGDYGNTNLVGGRTVPKDHPRVEAYGALDELNSWIGYTLSFLNEGRFDSLRDELTCIQHFLFDAGTDLADPEGKLPPKISEKETSWLEEKIDWYEARTPAIDSFILPGGTQQAGALQVARTITRRAEIRIITLKNTESEDVRVPVRTFINRLSDYFFAVARWVNYEQGVIEPSYDRGGKVFHLSEKEKDARPKYPKN